MGEEVRAGDSEGRAFVFATWSSLACYSCAGYDPLRPHGLVPEYP
jgi:hypothetical protein